MSGQVPFALLGAPGQGWLVIWTWTYCYGKRAAGPFATRMEAQEWIASQVPR